MATFSDDFHPAMYADVPLYNIQAVAAATGVPSITLRSWERRYGIPVPRRDAKGYRLYSERDIAIARWLRQRVQQGMGISQAVHMLQTADQRKPVPASASPFRFESMRRRLLDAVIRLDESAVSLIISEALTVAPVEDVALQLLQPALYEIGDQWAQGVLSVTSEHVASNLIRFHLAQLIRVNPPPLRQDLVLVGCAPGEMHDIGALMLALFLRRRGFSVVYAGASIEADSLISDVARIRPAAVCLSASSPESARALRDLYTGLQEAYNGVLALGGRCFNSEGSLGESIPGVQLGADAGSAVAELERLLST